MHGRHSKISQDQIDMRLMKNIEGSGTIAGDNGCIPLCIQHELHRLSDQRLVFNDENGLAPGLQ